MYLLREPVDLEPFFTDIGNRQIVLLGEASHGTHEYYTWRTKISQRLIEEKGFQFIAVEGDWPDCYRINRYIKGYKDAGTDIGTILRSFDRWPTWMWANWEIAALAEWLKEYNDPLPMDKKVGFYGLDVYSLWDSMKTMVHYLEKEDQQAAQYVKEAISCFEPFQENQHLYSQHSLTDHNCREEVVALLKEIRLKAQFLDGDREAGFNMEQNALIAVNAEKYYSSMLNFNDNSWNIRDRHMMETLERLVQFHGTGSKGIIWEHNTHIGDARATDMVKRGLINTGQLARERYGEENVYLVGFGSYTGTVIAAQAWGAPMQEMEVPPAKDKSIEAMLHDEPGKDCYILFRKAPWNSFLSKTGHRAIGVVYDPATERIGNYVPSILPKRYNAFIYLDQTNALHPLHLKPHDIEVPETYPFGV
ncbi:MAG TPA: erythromycin esterase family protein [Chitinophagaceae bacterium]|nr:erythromycin esterase family protein [Chitinophagaceae bacterium]